MVGFSGASPLLFNHDADGTRAGIDSIKPDAACWTAMATAPSTPAVSSLAIRLPIAMCAGGMTPTETSR